MCGLALTLHAVRGLDRSYAEAGLVTTAVTIGLGLGAPWRGRAVDRQGLRRAMVLSLLGAGTWFVAPGLGYVGLVVAAFVGGLLAVPAYSVTRQSLAVLVPDPQRRETVFALDAVANELTWIVGPLLAVVLATSVSTTAALLALGAVTVGAGAVLMVVNPPTRSSDDGATTCDDTGGSFAVARLVPMLGLCVALAVIFVGVDVSVLAALNEVGRPGDIGWVVACWSAGSLVGGLCYAGMGRRVSPLLLMAVFVLLIAPSALVPAPGALAVVLFVSGLPCAPALAAVTSRLVELTPEHRRGEVLGWAGSALTVGSGIGAPSVGAVIDHWGPSWGFATSAGIGITVVGLVVAGGWLARRFWPSDGSAGGKPVDQGSALGPG